MHSFFIFGRVMKIASESVRAKRKRRNLPGGVQNSVNFVVTAGDRFFCDRNSLFKPLSAWPPDIARHAAVR